MLEKGVGSILKRAIYTAALFDLTYTAARPLFEHTVYPWEILPDLCAFLTEYGQNLPAEDYDRAGDGVWIAKSAVVAPTAEIRGPAVIGPGAEVRHCAYIRGGALVGEGCVVRNSCELKNCVLFDGAKAPHYNYIGDSVLGHGAHMGAGAVTSNVKSDKTPVRVKWGGAEAGEIVTGLRKLGAMVGDFVEIGCNSVLCPGSVIGRGTIVYPLSRVRGVIEAERIYKGGADVVARERRS